MANVFYFPLLGTPTGLNYALSFYESGTDVPLDVWTDSDLTIAWAQPIIFNATGNPDGLIYVSPTPDMKVVYERPAVDGTIDDYVPVPGYPVDFVTPSTITNVTTTKITLLSNAQIQDLPTTPITVVTAPEAGTRAKPFACTLVADFTAGAYTNVNADGILQIQTTDGWALAVLIANDSTYTTDLTLLTTFLNAAQTRVVDLPIPFASAIDGGSVSGTVTKVQPLLGPDVTSVDGTALQIAIDNNGSGALTGGNAANTMTVTVYYALEVV